jgi:putative ABC transport system permease protein
MMLVKIAWRNVWRNKTRSLVITVAVAIGVWAAIFLSAFYNGMIEERIRSAIEQEISHLQVHDPKFKAEYDVQYFINGPVNTLQQVQQNPLVKTAAGRVILKGMIATASGSSGITINGIMPGEESQLTQLDKKIISGKYFSAKPYEILVGKKLMQKMKLKQKGKAILTFQDKDGNIASGAFRVVAVYKTVNTPYDETNVFVKINDLDTLAGIKGKYNEIAVLLHSSNDVEQYKTELQKIYKGNAVETWMQISPEMNLLVSATDEMMFIYMAIIILALAFGIVNTMLMAILERTREIGMMLALGMNKLKVFQMILLESIFLVVAGTPPGVLLALITVAYTHKKGISLARFSEAYSNFGYSSMVYPNINIKEIIIMLLMVIVTAIIAALFPAARALKLKPAEAIRK